MGGIPNNIFREIIVLPAAKKIGDTTILLLGSIVGCKRPLENMYIINAGGHGVCPLC
jgi:hypothetical protein